MNIPRRSPPDHPTGGLPGYPARDHFAAPGSPVFLLDRGYVMRLSGRDPSTGGRPGGSYGWSMYVQADDGSTWFLTHFATRRVRLGQRIGPKTKLGTIQSPTVAGMPRSAAHIHAGRRPRRASLAAGAVEQTSLLDEDLDEDDVILCPAMAERYLGLALFDRDDVIAVAPPPVERTF